MPAGGVLALADAVSDLRATSDAVVLLDAGDLFTGSLEVTMAEGAPIIAAYNVMGVDAVAIGNHEFDFGPVGYAELTAKTGVTDAAGAAGPRGALMARMAAASFPFLSANVHEKTTGTAPHWPHFAASTLIRRDGFEVGVVGYTSQETPATTSRENVADLDFSREAPASVASAIRALRAAGAAPVILLAHASLEGTLPQTLDEPGDPRGTKHRGEVASLVRALGSDRPDVIIAGHRPAWMLGRIDGIPIVSSDQHGVGLARIRFCRHEAEGAQLRSIDRYVLAASTPPRTDLGRSVARAVEPWMSAMKTTADAVVTTLPRPCVPQSVDGTAIAEQVTRALREAAASLAPRAAPVVAIANAGALRTSLDAGPLRYGALFAALPFEESVAVCATTRAGVTRVLDNALRDPSVRRHFPVGLAGAKATLARAKDGSLSLVRLDIDGVTASGDAPVWLAVPDFVLDGGDGLIDGVACASVVRSTIRIRDAWRGLLSRETGGCDGSAKNLSFQSQ
jgi:5'-nucleotidase